MLHRCDVDAIVVAVRADPCDPDDPLLEVHRRDQPIVVALDVNTMRSAETMLAVA